MPAIAAPLTSYFAILASPRAYATLGYLLLSLATGIFAFTFAMTGLSLSLGLAVLIVGIPFTLGFLALTRVLAVAEAGLLRALVDPTAPAAAPLLPAGEGWTARIRTLVVDRRTWSSLAYFLLLLPLGIAYANVLAALLIVALGLLAAPLVVLFAAPGTVSLDGLQVLANHPTAFLALCGLVGALLLPLTLHLGMALGRFQSWVARHLLVQA